MIKYLFIREPFEKNNVSPLMYRATKESDSNKKFSGDAGWLNGYSLFAGHKDYLINKYDRYDDELWKDPADDEEDYYED